MTTTYLNCWSVMLGISLNRNLLYIFVIILGRNIMKQRTPPPTCCPKTRTFSEQRRGPEPDWADDQHRAVQKWGERVRGAGGEAGQAHRPAGHRLRHQGGPRVGEWEAWQVPWVQHMICKNKVDTTNRCEALKEVYVFEMFNIKTSLHQTPPYQRAQIFQIFWNISYMMF